MQNVFSDLGPAQTDTTAVGKAAESVPHTTEKRTRCFVRDKGQKGEVENYYIVLVPELPQKYSQMKKF